MEFTGFLELFFHIHKLEPRRDHSHKDERFWKDLPPENGQIKTVCKKCGGFVGYRPVEIKKGKR